jgi:hypothetical protein
MKTKQERKKQRNKDLQTIRNSIFIAIGLGIGAAIVGSIWVVISLIRG